MASYYGSMNLLYCWFTKVVC